MNKDNKVPRIRRLLSGDFNEFQKDCLEMIFNKLSIGEKLNVKDIRGLNDLTHMRCKEFIEFTGFNKVHLTEMRAACPTMVNSDGTYSATNLMKYLRSADYRKKQGNINIQNNTSISDEEQRELTARERIDHAKAIQEEAKASKVQEETITVDEHKQILTTRFRNLIQYVKINFECKFKELANKTENEMKILGKKIMKELLTAYCDEFKEIDEENE